MNFPFKSLLNSFSIEKSKEFPDILANGSIADKRDIEDPTGKFSGPVHVEHYIEGPRPEEQMLLLINQNMIFQWLLMLFN